MEVNFYLHECTLFQDVYRTLWESTVLIWFILTSPKCPKYVHNDETFRGLSGNVTFRFCVCWVRLFTNRTWHTRSGRPKREFCTDTFRLMIRDSHARDVYAIIDDVTTPYEPLYVIVSVIVGFRNLSNVTVWMIRHFVKSIAKFWCTKLVNGDSS